jgi:putative endonuclease
LPWSNKDTSHARGKVTEAFAENYLTQFGLIPIDRNVHCRQGEIDLVMRDGDTFVFVEVKYRKNNHFGSAIETISIAKQNKIRHCVAFFFQQANLNEYNTPCRFDVIALEGNINQPQVTWLKNAF